MLRVQLQRATNAYRPLESAARPAPREMPLPPAYSSVVSGEAASKAGLGAPPPYTSTVSENSANEPVPAYTPQVYSVQTTPQS